MNFDWNVLVQIGGVFAVALLIFLAAYSQHLKKVKVLPKGDRFKALMLSFGGSAVLIACLFVAEKKITASATSQQVVVEAPTSMPEDPYLDPLPSPVEFSAPTGRSPDDKWFQVVAAYGQRNYSKAMGLMSDPDVRPDRPEDIPLMRGAIYSEMGQYTEAAACYRQAAEIDPANLDTQDLAAVGYLRANNPREGIRFAKRAFDNRRKLNGEFHPKTLRSKHNLGLCMFESKPSKAAAKLLKEVYATQIEKYDTSSNEAVVYGMSVVNVLRLSGDPKELDHAIDLGNRLLDTATGLQNEGKLIGLLANMVGGAYQTRAQISDGESRRDDLKQAVATFESARRRMDALSRPLYLEKAIVAMNAADSQCDLQQYDVAAKNLSEAENIMKAIKLSTTNPRWGNLWLLQGKVLARQGSRREAEPYFRRTVELWTTCNHPGLQSARLSYIKLLRELGRYRDADYYESFTLKKVASR